MDGNEIILKNEIALFKSKKSQFESSARPFVLNESCPFERLARSADTCGAMWIRCRSHGPNDSK